MSTTGCHQSPRLVRFANDLGGVSFEMAAASPDKHSSSDCIGPSFLFCHQSRKTETWRPICCHAGHASAECRACRNWCSLVISRTSVVAVSLVSLVPIPASAADAVDFAARQIGKPYVWGAEGPDSFDCSGLTQYAYGEAGLDLPRRAISQSKAGERTGDRLQRGDLVFFSTDPRRSEVTHVGIYEGRGIMINASKRNGRVRRDDLSDPYWADRFMFARRVASLVARGGRNERPDETIRQPRSSGRIDRRKIATAVVERIADILLKRPRN